jgi:hypothetical protein
MLPVPDLATLVCVGVEFCQIPREVPTLVLAERTEERPRVVVDRLEDLDQCGASAGSAHHDVAPSVARISVAFRVLDCFEIVDESSYVAAVDFRNVA